MRAHLKEIYRAALGAVQADQLMPIWIGRDGRWIRLGDQLFDGHRIRRFYVVSVGKAAAAMSRTLESILGDQITAGVTITKDGHGMKLRTMPCLEAGHPVPDQRSLHASLAVEQLLNNISSADLVLVLLSGGASALLADPTPGLSLDSLQALTGQLLRSGADIHEINTVRKHFSRLKGGQLTRLVYPAQLVCLALSDVVGDEPEVIGSGPTVADPSSFRDAAQVLKKYGIMDGLDEALAASLQKGLRGERPETPKPSDPIFGRSRYHLIGSNAMALKAAAAKARELGYEVAMDLPMMQGESREQAVKFATGLRGYRGVAPVCVLMGGETTVSIRGNGVGGRNQEFALALLNHWIEAGESMAEIPAVLSAATDGGDGPTDAAGALVDGTLVQWCREKGLYPKSYLVQNDSYSFFKQSDAHFFTGPTYTNVMDLVIALIP